MHSNHFLLRFSWCSFLRSRRLVPSAVAMTSREKEPKVKAKRNRPSKQGSYYKQYENETSPLFPLATAGMAMNAEAPASPTGESHTQYNADAGHASNYWRAHYAGLVAVNAMLFAIGCASIGFVLFYHVFFSTVWEPMFAAAIVMGVVLIGHGVYGVTVVCFSKYTPLAAYGISAFLLIAAVASTEAIFFVAWNDLESDVDRSSLSNPLSSYWTAAVLSGGSGLSNVCSVQTLFHCSGWRAGCWTFEGSYNEMTSREAEVVRWERQKVLTAISLAMLNDDSNTTLDPPPTVYNITQGGNCPVCFADSVYAGYNRTCGDAIADKLNASVWYVLASGILIGFLVAANVLWATRSRENRRRAKISVELLDAQRYL